MLLTQSGNEGSFIVNGSTTAVTSAMFSAVPGTGGAWVGAQVNLSSYVTALAGSLISNTSGLFHMGLINGQALEGARYGFFSDFGNSSGINEYTVCRGDTLQLDGGINDTSYLWSDSTRSRYITVHDSGTYWLIANNGYCVLYDTFHVRYANPIPMHIIGDSSICSGESTLLSIGSSFNSIHWNGIAGDTTYNVTTGGIYHVTALDPSNCPVSDSFKVTVHPVPSLILDSVINVSCKSPLGSIYTHAVGGSPRYHYQLSGGATNMTGIFNSLTTGSYSITTTDSFGCTKIGTYNISSSNSISILLDTINTFCGQPNGQCAVHVSGGHAPYYYNWSNGVHDSVNPSLFAGLYSVNVIDQDSCSMLSTT